MKKKLIELKDFSFKYHTQAEPTLRHLDLTIYEGEKVLIAGPSGSGKSTLGQLLNGIIPHIHKGEMTGEFLLGGKPAYELSVYDKSQMVSTVLQDTDGQFIGLSVAEDMSFALENDMIDQAAMIDSVLQWAKRLELDAFLGHRPQDLSGGQKQRVSLAGVLIDESPILLFDEPLANLDPQAGKDTIELIKGMQAETGVTTLIIEHRLEEVLALELDRILLINDGEILWDGKPSSLLATGLLVANGIREPLYLSVLKRLGFKVTPDMALDRLELLELDLGEAPLFHMKEEQQNRDAAPLLRAEHLAFGYRPDRMVLNGVSLSLSAGERVAIVGKNGAGKSTLAKALCGFVASEGEIYWDGQSIAGDSLKERAERIGYVLQNPNQMISQTMIFEEVALGLRLRGFSDDEIEQRVHEMLRICGLYAMRKWPISALSYGQKKRVTIASILVLGAKVLVLDEPTAGQDQAHYEEMMVFLDELAEAGHTIVMITHDMQLMLEHSDRCLVIHDGKVIADQAPIAVLSDQELLAKAHLRETSVFRLAQMLDWDPVGLTYFYKERGNINGFDS